MCVYVYAASYTFKWLHIYSAWCISEYLCKSPWALCTKYILAGGKSARVTVLLNNSQQIRTICRSLRQIYKLLIFKVELNLRARDNLDENE